MFGTFSYVSSSICLQGEVGMKQFRDEYIIQKHSDPESY